MRIRSLTMMTVAMLSIGSVAFAQQPGEGEVSTSSVAETFCFSSGAGNASTSFCVSDHGTVTRFRSPTVPVAFEHIRIATILEGYAVCAGTTVLNNDISFAEAGWGPGVVIAGPTATSVTIRRTSLDGRWELTQKFLYNKTLPQLQITMTLKNLGPTVLDVRLARIVDWDNDNTVGGDNQFLLERGTAANGDGGHTTTLTNTTFTQPADRAIAGFGAACSPASVAVPTLSDLTSVVTARLGNMATGKVLKTTFVYRRE